MPPETHTQPAPGATPRQALGAGALGCVGTVTPNSSGESGGSQLPVKQTHPTPGAVPGQAVGVAPVVGVGAGAGARLASSGESGGS